MSRKALPMPLLALGMVACSAASTKPEAPPPAAQPAYQAPPGGDQSMGHGYGMAPPPPPNDPVADLDRAEAELDAALRGEFATAPTDGEEGVPQASPPPKQESEADRCARACRALASMRRAAEHLCGLDETEKRCDDAQERVTVAAERVKATCTKCAEEDT